MVRPFRSDRPSTVRKLSATVVFNRQPFIFQLHSRPLRLGTDTVIQYYWMDSSNFRAIRSTRADPSNFRNCVGLWWAAMREAGWADETAEIQTLLLATAHALSAGSKSLQRIYRDAHLAPGRTNPADDGLPDETRAAIRSVVANRDSARVQAEFEAALSPGAPDPRLAPALRRMFDGFLTHGVDLFRQHGMDGLAQFLARLDQWSIETRRKGGRELCRTFLNEFGYEAKVRFYMCYANAWIALIPWLREHDALDATSEQFLRVWHMQAQEVTLPDGREVPDVFAGQVLSLHPLSGFFMKDPALLAVAGRFFGTEAYNRVYADGQSANPAYWDWVGAVLTAAHLYRQALDRQAGNRSTRTVNRGDVATAHDDLPSALGLLSEYLAEARVRCTECGDAVEVTSFRLGDNRDCHLDLRCPRGHTSTHCLAEADLAEWVTPHR